MKSKNPDKLPEGVGKRIIESLKNQELEADYDLELETEEQEDIETESIVEPVEDFEAEAEVEELEEAEEVEEEFKPEPETAASVESYQPQELYETKEQSEFGVSDIDTLLNLISQLPSGVTKQTGALIIRQTMEAMGISMNKVLGDAQSVQEEFENNIRNNINVIEEYRTKIKILEQEINKFRKKSHELEDVISLFILSDEK